jgi:gentisate 1,2-dioxygenase
MDTPTETPYFIKPEVTPERREFYDRIGTKGAAPLWEVLTTIIPARPSPVTMPVIWRYADMRPLLMEAGRLLTPKEAERRVLILENPGAKGQSRTTGSLYAGLQLILPGEVAHCHRHTQSAIRFVLESGGAYTAVNGERTTMHQGDFILTPSWTYHDHGNTTDTPTVWLDGLDIPMVSLFDTGFFEACPDGVQPNDVPDGDSTSRFAANMVPVDFTPTRPSSPIFNYPYSRSREALAALERNGPPHPSHGVKMRFVNPVSGGYPLPTIGAFMQLLPKGFKGEAYRQTDGAIYTVVEGRGRSVIAGTAYEWGPRDIFVVPSWALASHEATEQSVLFSMSDRPAQQALGFWREQVPA